MGFPKSQIRNRKSQIANPLTGWFVLPKKSKSLFSLKFQILDFRLWAFQNRKSAIENRKFPGPHLNLRPETGRGRFRTKVKVWGMFSPVRAPFRFQISYFRLFFATPITHRSQIANLKSQIPWVKGAAGTPGNGHYLTFPHRSGPCGSMPVGAQAFRPLLLVIQHLAPCQLA
jgi:hypothetical protein